MTAAASEGRRVKKGLLAQELAPQQKTAEGGKMSNHSSRASDGLRPTHGTSWRPEVPTGVGPMINMQSGEAKDQFLAGAAHDGHGVLSSGFQRQSRVAPPVLKGDFQNFKHEFLLKANMLDISSHFVGQRTRVVPVGDPLE